MSSLGSSAAVDLYVRPEHFCIKPAGEPGTLTASVISHVYHGGHVDLRLKCREHSLEDILVRSSGDQAIERWPVGMEVGLSVDSDGCAAFSAA